MRGNHPFVKWAIKSIENYIKDGKIADPIRDGAPEALLLRRAGAFVSLHLLDGSLRGCIGTFMPTKANLAIEVRDNAIAAATEDPRFPPVAEDELDQIDVTVDILSEPEKVKDLSQLDPKKYGVIVVSGYKRGLLLPDLPGVDTVEQQIQIALRKAGISERERFDVYRFTVERYH
ncbi:AmmeMemoRadiSam system protein A [Pseudothermotoga sp.]|nr:AmmeMemoRadiSam system protein A [Pseudothermotoga sp.]MCX7812352.1 AmmeMemoRadiSam system protein A [Pseudothermotoga sp.]MDW8139422.1 AmmeMemoRadiSam system protein A [Pseudothermotoga sp.]